jgi:tRNA pseudouridine38-40 synthase
MNSILPDDISVKNIEQVDNRFHAQKSAKWKWYQYKIVSRERRSCFDERCFYTRQSLNVERINKMLSYLIGEHDFSAFKSSNTSNPAKICVMYKAQCTKSGDEYLFDFVADRFLYNMIRSIIGTVIMIEKDNLSPSKMNEILKSKDRTKAGQTADSNGLVLKKVSYTQEIKLEA